jgi:ferritin
MTPKKLPVEIVNLLNERINDEYGHHYFYRQVANFCENVGFMKAAKYFHDESHEEVEHAEMLQKYLTDWNVQPSLAPIEPPLKVKDLVDALEKAYQKEYDLYEQYEEISGEIFKMGDYCTFDFLKKFRTIQTEAVATYSTFLNQLDTIDKEDKNWVYLFEKNAF